MNWAPARRRILQILLAIYVPLLVIGAWPFNSIPFLGPASYFSRLTLSRIAVTPGMAVFTGIQSEYAATSTCARISGKGTDGKWRLLYQNECPPRSNWKNSRHQLIEHHFVAMDVPNLIGNWDPLPAQPTEGLRRFVALGDLACHSKYLGALPRQQARLEVTQNQRSVLSGKPMIARFTCDWDCDERKLASPRCRHLKDDPIFDGLKGR